MEICLFQPDIPDNVGLVIRTMACIGVQQIRVVMPTGFVFDVRETRRKSLDYADKISIIKNRDFTHLKEDIGEYVSQGKKVPRLVLLTTKTNIFYDEFEFMDDDILIVGNESRGVTDEVCEYVTHKVKIPMADGCRSINMAVSASIVASEAMRQCRARRNPSR